MKRLIVISLLAIATGLCAQTIQVGDSVTVNRTTKHWMTGERISSWVYLQSHAVTQVGSAHHPGGILLNIDGAKSWIKEDEVSKTTASKNINTIVVSDTIIMHDTIITTKETERIVYVHDTVMTEKEIRKEASTTLLDESKQIYFQFYGNFNQYFGPKNYGAGGEFIFGARLTEYAYIGGGVEFAYMGAGENMAKSMQFPVFVHSKIYVPIRHLYFPYAEMSLGANMGYRTFTPDETLRPNGFHYGVYAKGGLGIDLLKCLSLGIGYQYGGEFSKISNDLHHAYIKIGFVIPE